MRSMHRVTRLHRISSYGTRVIRKAVGLGVQRTRNHHLHGCAVRFAGEASTSQKSKASGDDLAPAAQSNPVASTGGSESGSGDGEYPKQPKDEGKSDYYYAGILMLATLFVGIPSTIIYELRFDHESREWADENAPAVVKLVEYFIDIRGSEVEPEFSKVDRPESSQEIEVKFANGSTVVLKAECRESVYSVVHRAAQLDGTVSFREVVDVKAKGDAEDLAATGLAGISSPLEVMRPSRKAADELRAVLAELRETATYLRRRLDLAGGATASGSDKLMGWDKLNKLEITIASGEKQLRDLEAQLPMVEGSRQEARDRAAAVAQAAFEQAWRDGRPPEPWIGIAPVQGRE